MPLSAKEVAIRLDTDARTLRKFLREITDADEQPGQGGRWLFEKSEIKELKKKFAGWHSSQAAPKSKRSKSKAVAEVEIDEEDELEEIELDDEDEPDDEDLEDIEDEEEDEDIEEL